MRNSMFSRRRVTLLLCVAVALASVACGRNRVALDVDARSFMDDSKLVQPYVAPPLIPIAVRLDSIQIDLIEGFNDFGSADAATIDIGIDYDNTAGSGAGGFRLYFSDDPATLFSTTPVAIIAADLAPASLVSRTAQIQADERILGLLTSKRFWMGVDLEWSANGVEPVQGTMTIAQINLHLVSTMDLFN